MRQVYLTNLEPFYQKLIYQLGGKDIKSILFPLLRDHLHKSLEALAQEDRKANLNVSIEQSTDNTFGRQSLGLREKVIYVKSDWVAKTIGEGALTSEKDNHALLAESFWNDLFDRARQEGRDFFYSEMEKPKEIPLNVPGIVPIYESEEGCGGNRPRYGIRVF